MLRQRGVYERVQVRTFHAWCEDMVRSYQVDVPGGRTRDSAYYAALVQAVERALETGMVPSGQYLALLVDEAHDFEEDWLRLCTRLVDPTTRSLLVMYDDAQSIYQKKRRSRFTFAGVGIEAQGRRTQILKLNYRNTREVLTLAVRCADALLQVDDEASDTAAVTPISAGRAGPVPVLIRARSAEEEAKLVAQRIGALPHKGEPLDDEVRLLYVGMTRATQTLTLSAAGRSLMVDRVASALEGSAEVA